jgi:hypothetical protein
MTRTPSVGLVYVKQNDGYLMPHFDTRLESESRIRYGIASVCGMGAPDVDVAIATFNELCTCFNVGTSNREDVSTMWAWVDELIEDVLGPIPEPLAFH